jgi:hypothetical protein
MATRWPGTIERPALPIGSLNFATEIRKAVKRVRSPWYEGFVLLAKKTAKNQITLPKAVITRFPDVEYFEVSTDGECIILHPLRRSRADEVRARLVQLGIDEHDVTAAVSWSRETESL